MRRSRQSTFSLLPIQLIPFFLYTVNAVLGAVLLAFRCWQKGQGGFYGASVEVDPDSMVTPYLVACWLTVVVNGLRRAHGILVRFYDLSDVKIAAGSTAIWHEVSGYFLAFGLNPTIAWARLVWTLINRYSRITGRFLFGAPSQHRMANCH